MRIALISDIHGNLVSLDAVLKDLAQQGADRIICLGDVATLGPQPRKALARVRELTADCIMGNHDMYLLDPALGKAYMDVTWFEETIDWCISRISPADFDFLRSFKPLIPIALDDMHTLLCFHGSPHSNTDVILATTTPSELDELLAGHTAAVMAGGHTHVQMLRQHNGMLVVNVGSVGMPFERTPFPTTPRVLPWAEYAIINWQNGVLSVDLRRVPINMVKVKQSALDSTMPDRFDWVKNWID